SGSRSVRGGSRLLGLGRFLGRGSRGVRCGSGRRIRSSSVGLLGLRRFLGRGSRRSVGGGGGRGRSVRLFGLGGLLGFGFRLGGVALVCGLRVLRPRGGPEGYVSNKKQQGRDQSHKKGLPRKIHV